jgi:hypothetical protein
MKYFRNFYFHILVIKAATLMGRGGIKRVNAVEEIREDVEEKTMLTARAT